MDTYLGNTNDPLSLNLYTYCLNNPHKYTDPSGHIAITTAALLLVAAGMGIWSAKAEYDCQVAEGDNYTNLVSIGVVGVSNTLLCLIPGGKAVSAYKMATAGGSFVLKTFAVQFGKAVGLGVAAGYATDAGIEVARQLATGTKLTNLEYDRIAEAGVTGAIAGGAGAIFGAGVEVLANTRVGQSVAAKFTQAVSKGRDAIKNGFAKVAGKSGKSSVREMTGLGESRFKLNLQFFASSGECTSKIDYNLVGEYIKDVENRTGTKLSKNQISELKNALRSKEYKKMSVQETAVHRTKFKKVKDSLIREWENKTNQQWPRYIADEISPYTGKVVRRAGAYYDAHHIIENSFGGEHAWWNIHPAKFPSEHQIGIHGADSPASRLFK